MSAEKEGQPSTAKYESIVVTLTQNDPPADSPFPVRSIRLSSSQPMAQVRRSSKTLSKGLAPSEDNAYFDSPVMSRTHAEILADLDTGDVRLKDTKSLHGVFVNEKSVDLDRPVVLHTGDTIAFGIHVARALEIFGPTEVKVGITCHEAEPTAGQPRAYRAPEPSDEMSDADSDCSVVYSVGPEKENGIRTTHESADSDDESCRIILPPHHEPTQSVKSFALSDSDSSSSDDSDYGEVESTSGDDNRNTIVVDSDDDDVVSAGDKDEEVMEIHDFRDAAVNGEYGAADHGSVNSDSAIDVAKTDASECFGDGSEFLMAEIVRMRSQLKQSAEAEDEAIEIPEATEVPEAIETPEAPETPEVDMAVEESLPEAAVPEAAVPEAVVPEVAILEENPWTLPTDEPAKEAEDVQGEPGDQVHEDEIKPSCETAASGAATNKCNISSILNPSPPPSSPLEEAYATIADINKIEDLDITYRKTSTCKENRPPHTQLPVKIDNAVASAVSPKKSERLPVHTDLIDDGIPLDLVGRMGMSLLDSSEIFAYPNQDHFLDMILEGDGEDDFDEDDLEDDGFEDDDEYEARMTSAAVFQARKKEEQSKKKRKADDMLKDSAEAAAAAATAAAAAAFPSVLPSALPSAAAGVSGKESPVHPSHGSAADMSADALPSKRQATETAMRAGRMTKGTAWAFAEKIGIAALGGAVVLGSLIYTAPAL